jgi:hypothetical protein
MFGNIQQASYYDSNISGGGATYRTCGQNYGHQKRLQNFCERTS